MKKGKVLLWATVGLVVMGAITIVVLMMAGILPDPFFPAPAPAAPAVNMALNGDLRICPDMSARITFENVDKENPLRVNEIAFVNDVLWLNLSTKTPLFGWARAEDVTYESGAHPSKDDTTLAGVQILDKKCAADELVTPKPPATENASATEEPAKATQEPAKPKQLDVVTYTPTENAIPLINNGETIGFFFVLNKVGPVDVLSPYQSTAIFSLGNGKVGDTTVTSDGTQGNIVTVLCNKPEGCVTTVTDYTAGHVGVTIVFAGKEIPAETVLGAVVNLFKAPNCGASGCPSVFHWQNGQSEAFMSVPTSVELDIPWQSVTVSTAIIGEPPANAKVIKIDKKVVGHSYTCSGECSVSVPEGAGGTIACFPEGGTADGKTVDSGKILSWNGADSDSGTPEDLNNTVLLVGNNIQIIMIYMADLEPFMNVACGQ
jgi:hypothetical protein